MKATVVIPTYNRNGQVTNALTALLKQSLPEEEFEIIVVNDGSTDSTDAKITQFFCVNNRKTWQYIHYNQNRGKAAALNLGIRAAKAPLIVFTDDDCVPSSTWVEMHVRQHLASDRPLAVLGSVSFPKEWVVRSNFVRYANSRYVGNRSERSVGGDFNNLPSRYFGGLNISIHKQQLLQVGLFNEAIGRGQDVELGYRLWKSGVKIVYEPQASILHFEPEVQSIRKRILKQARVYQESKPLINQLHPEMGRSGNWFFEPPELGTEPFKHTILKFIVRIVVRPFLAKHLLSFLEWTDSQPLLYNPLLYQYVFASACLENIKQREP
ncbi:MAG TPA: glycosyltransferase [Chloroflexi bacterium]|nr:glycosyltransferase [Chloroflexota bacterium]